MAYQKQGFKDGDKLTAAQLVKMEDGIIEAEQSAAQGEDGATFTPSVDANGNLSWENDKGLANPATVNVKGPKGDKGDDGVADYTLVQQYEQSARGAAGDASDSAESAAGSAKNAVDAAAEAAVSAENAGQSASDAAASASNAQTSETNAATSASTATSKASAASTSASNAKASETNAAASATAAAESAKAAEDAAASIKSDVPDYVQAEAERVAAQVQNRQGANTITFLACSDIHHSTVNYAAQMKETLAHLRQGMKLIREKVSIDFAACLGDSIWDATNETVEDVQTAAREVNAAIFPAFNGIPNFRLIGNHEGHYNGTEKLTNEQVFAKTAAFNAGAVFDEDNRLGGYCYRDFEDRKLRVVCMNTTEKDPEGGYTVSAGQLEWLAEVLNLSSLGDGWKSIILSHIPLDWFGATSSPLTIVNAAESVLCNVHGHTHNYLSGTLEGTDIPRFAIPNGCFYRNNEYGENGATEWNGMEFGETTTYNKTAGTANDTAFCVVTIDLDNLIAYADRYGAGYDREITLPGEVVAGYTNLVPTALAFDSSGSVFNGTGYMNGKYLSTTSPYYNTDASTVVVGLLPYKNSGSNGYKHTPPTIYIKGITLDTTNNHNRIGVSRTVDNGAVIGTKNAPVFSEVFNVETLGAGYYKLTPLMDSSSGMNMLYSTWGWASDYIAFSFTGTGENLIITLDEPIE